MNRASHWAGLTLMLGMLAAVPCCTTMNAAIPATASEVASGTGNTSYRAADSGTVYVYDKTYNQLRYSGAVRPGQLVTVDAKNDQILVDGRPVVQQIPLDDNAQYEILMDSRAPVVERRTVIEREVRER